MSENKSARVEERVLAMDLNYFRRGNVQLRLTDSNEEDGTLLRERENRWQEREQQQT